MFILHTMEELTLTTPSLFFSAISLIMLAYTNRFMGYAQLVRNLALDYQKNPTEEVRLQIRNIRKRLSLIRLMQVLGIISLLLCTVSMFLIYINMPTVAVYIFGIAMLSLIISLTVSIQEIIISVRALDIHLARLCDKNN